MQRLLAEHGLVISKGKMSNLWSGKPITLMLDDLDVICKVLDCGPGELLLPEPDKIRRQPPNEVELRPAASDSGFRPQPRPRGYRSLPPT
jgi:DNA-binding Xre family transcriptional regulator